MSMKVICEKTVLGVTAVRVITTPVNGDQGVYIRSLVGVGKPYWVWATIPAGTVIGADFTDAPICSNDSTINNATIADIVANGPFPEAPPGNTYPLYYA